MACYKLVTCEQSSLFITSKTIDNCRIVHPQNHLLTSLKNIKCFTLEILNDKAHLENIFIFIFNTLKTIDTCIINISDFNCRSKEKILLNFIKFCIRLYCKRMNEKLVVNYRSHAEKLKKLN